MRKIFLIVLIVLNLMVLMGQILPEMVPPFAKTINLVFLSLTLLYLIVQLIRASGKKNRDKSFD